MWRKQKLQSIDYFFRRYSINKIIIALDVSSENEAQRIVDSLEDEINFYKVGLQLLTSVGPSFIKKLVQSNKKVFLDLKLHEIPNTVASAVLAAGDLGVSMITVHASGGRKIMEVATKVAESFPGLEILGLTVVTSLTDRDLQEIGILATCEEQTLRLAKLANESGCHGLVASPLNLLSLRNFTKSMTIVTPGIRLKKENVIDGQEGFDTPSGAIKNGASFIILGRGVIESANPKSVVQSILAEI